VATSSDIARAAGVSQSTVSRVLNGDPRVARQTRDRVAGVIEQIGYTPNGVARGLVTRRTQLVGVVVSDVTNPFYPELLEAIEHQLTKHGLKMILSNAGERPEDAYMRVLEEHRVDGIVFTAAKMDSEAVRTLARRRFPIVVANRSVDGVECDSVTGDNEPGARAAAQHLLDLGHRRIGILSGHPEASTSRDRLAGLVAALADADAEPDPSLMRVGWYSYGVVSREAVELHTLEPSPKAIFSLDDLMAFAALNAAVAVGREVPRELSVVGFDDIRMASWERFQLTTVRQPLAEMARTSADLVAQRIETPDAPYQRLVFPSLLVRRRTTAAPARRRNG